MPIRLPYFSVRLCLRVALSAGVVLLGIANAEPPVRAPQAPAKASVAATTPPPKALENPYLAIVPVDDESNKSRDKGLRLALIEVLRRAAGKQDYSFGPILANAASLVQSYSFQRDPSSAALSFRAAFDPTAVDNALKQQGLPVFGLKTDVVEAWVTDVHGLRDASDYARTLDHFSHLRGVRRLDVAEVRDGTVRLRMIVEGGVASAAELALAGGVVRADADGNHDLIR